MRINKFIAQATGLSRRAADAAIAEGRVQLNGQPVEQGQAVTEYDVVALDGKQLSLAADHTIIMLNKPPGYVCSREGQGNPTVYELLPLDMYHLKPVGRLDKDSSGLLLLTDDGNLANRLTHPRFAKEKVYEIELDKPLASKHQQAIENGVVLEDGPSRLQLYGEETHWTVKMSEGRNRQIRRTFAALGYNVRQLERVQFGPYELGQLAPGQFVPA